MSSRDHYLAQATLRTRRPEPMVSPEAKAVRKCERCGCKLASDQGPYRGRLLCSPCLAPIHTVLEGIPAGQRTQVVAQCSGHSTRAVSETLSIGLSTPATRLFATAKLCGLTTATLRNVITWAVANGVIPADPQFPVGGELVVAPSKQGRKREVPVVAEKRSKEYRRVAALCARDFQIGIGRIERTVPVEFAGTIIAATKAAYHYGRAEASAESLEALGD